MKIFIVKAVKIMFTVICVSFLFSGVAAIFASDSKQDSILPTIIISLLLGVLPLYLMWFKDNKSIIKNKNYIKTGVKEKSNNKNVTINSTTFNNETLLDLLWFINGKYKNYSINIEHYEYKGYTLTIYSNRDSEPSAIDVTLPIKKPKNIMFVGSLGYYPRYEDLTAEQRWMYLNWLENIEQQVDIGYVFLFYYGLERWLFTDNYEKAFITIIQLRKYHLNPSFQSYSFNVLVAALLFHKREDLFENLIDVSDEVNISGIYLYVKAKLNININADEIIALASSCNFSNKRYIKSNYDLFKSVLLQNIKEKYHDSEYPVRNIDITKCAVKSYNIVANISLYPREISLPDITSDKNFKQEIYTLLAETHEKVKEILRINRKKNQIRNAIE